MTQACRLRFCVVNHLSHTVNDFSTSSRVMDNQKERVGWVLLSQFFNGRRRESEGLYIITVLLLCCARFSIWALTLNVAPWAKSMMDFPSWQLPLFQRSTQDERGGRGGEGEMSGDGRGPHIEWEAAKWSLCSSSSGPVVLEGWLLQANATNCKPGNTSVQLGSLCGTQSLQQVEACKAGTEREYRGKTEREWVRNRHKHSRAGRREVEWLVTQDTETKTFSPPKPKAALQWQRQRKNAMQISMVILSLQSFFLSLSSCSYNRLCLYLFSSRYNWSPLFILLIVN